MVTLRRNTSLSNAHEEKDPIRCAKYLDWLILDYVTLRYYFPTPQTARTRTAPQASREYGHPAQWASDTARAIADCLDTTDEALRDHLGHTPPPPRTRSETRVVNHAYRSLKTRIHDLANYPGTEAFLEEASEIHHRIRRALGQTRQRKALALPCPNCTHLPVFRTVYDDRRDVIECHHCGHEIKEQEYGLYARIIIDELLEATTTTQQLFDSQALPCHASASGETLPNTQKPSQT